MSLIIYSAFMLMPLSWGSMAAILTLAVALSASFMALSIGAIHKVPYKIGDVGLALLPALLWLALIFVSPLILYQKHILLWHLLGGLSAAAVLLPMFINPRAIRWSLPLSLCAVVALYLVAR